MVSLLGDCCCLPYPTVFGTTTLYSLSWENMLFVYKLSRSSLGYTLLGYYSGYDYSLKKRKFRVCNLSGSIRFDFNGSYYQNSNKIDIRANSFSAVTDGLGYTISHYFPDPNEFTTYADLKVYYATVPYDSLTSYYLSVVVPYLTCSTYNWGCSVTVSYYHPSDGVIYSELLQNFFNDVGSCYYLLGDTVSIDFMLSYLDKLPYKVDYLVTLYFDDNFIQRLAYAKV